MKLLLKFIIFALVISSCSKKSEEGFNTSEKFTSELTELKEYFKIPGLAVSIVKDGNNIYKKCIGVSDIDNQIKVDANTLFPIASITKVFSGVLILKLAEQKKLSLEDPVNKFLPKPILSDSILIKHILSHTSQGNIGKKFYYSSRFGLLTNVIEQSSGNTFAELLNQEILLPLKLENTFLLKDSTQLAADKRIMAKPYVLDNGIENGFIDFGYSSSAGIVSNLSDLAIFNKAFDDNSLISKESKDKMFSSFTDDSPYGFGIFNQEFQKTKLVWTYGQYDCYSSLLLKIPSENITLTILANNNLLSDPARLIYGDATTSLFVMSFLKNHIFELEKMDLFETQDSISKTNFPKNEFYRKKVLAQALAESYMTRFQTEKLKSSATLLHTVFDESPDYLDYADLNLLHNLSFLKDVAFHRELGDFNDFDTQIELIGEKILNKQPENPYAHSYMATYFDRKGNIEKAKYHYEKIVNAKNFSKNWYTNEAQSWLNDNN